MKRDGYHDLAGEGKEEGKEVKGVSRPETRLKITDLATADLATGLLPGKRPCNRAVAG